MHYRFVVTKIHARHGGQKATVWETRDKVTPHPAVAAEQWEQRAEPGGLGLQFHLHYIRANDRGHITPLPAFHPPRPAK